MTPGTSRHAPERAKGLETIVAVRAFEDRRSNQQRSKPVKTTEPPEGLSDGLYTAVESDGRVKFILTRRRKPIAQVTLPANEAGYVAANALGGAYDAFDQAAMGLVPAGERKTTYPFVRITGLGLGPCPIEGHACLIVKVGAAELGFAFPLSKLKEFAQWMAAQELPEK
jgi:hypothetical protein